MMLQIANFKLREQRLIRPHKPRQDGLDALSQRLQRLVLLNVPHEVFVKLAAFSKRNIEFLAASEDGGDEVMAWHALHLALKDIDCGARPRLRFVYVDESAFLDHEVGDWFAGARESHLLELVSVSVAALVEK